MLGGMVDSLCLLLERVKQLNGKLGHVQFRHDSDMEVVEVSPAWDFKEL